METYMYNNPSQTNIKICLFSGDISRPGGTERVAVFLANGLCRDPRFDISIVSITESEPEPAFKISAEIPRYTLSDKWVVPGPGYLKVISRLSRLIRKEKFSVIIDVDTVLDILSIPCKWLTGVKVISWEHFHFFADLGTSYRAWCRKAACRFSDYIVTLTERDASVWKEYGRPKCPVQAIHNPSDYMPPYDSSIQREKSFCLQDGFFPQKVLRT